MKSAKPTLASLQRDRDGALSRTTESFQMVQRRLDVLDRNLAVIANDHPVLALGGAAVAGGAAGLIAPPLPMGNIAKLARVLLLGPATEDLTQQLLWVLNGLTDDESPPADAPVPPPEAP